MSKTWDTLSASKKRFELFAASDDRPAYDGEFTQRLIKKLSEGVPGQPRTLNADSLDPYLRLDKQVAQRATFVGRMGLESHWLSYNKHLQNSADDAEGQGAVDRAVRLTSWLQPTGTLAALVEATHKHPCVVLTGVKGTGKSTLAAALAQPARARESVGAGLAHAIAFGAHNTYGSNLAAVLAGQLRRTIDDFAEAVDRFEIDHPGERNQRDALERNVIGPLRLLKLKEPVRLVFDNFDEMPLDTQAYLKREILTEYDDTVQRSDQTNIKYVLTTRPAAELVPGKAEKLHGRNTRPRSHCQLPTRARRSRRATVGARAE